jgi:hypothetical protein
MRFERSCKIFSRTRLLLFFCLIFFCRGLRSQETLYYHSGVGINLGANLALGSHFQRFGMNFHFFYINDHFQSNTEVRAYFDFKSLGPPILHPELVISQGLLFAYGAPTATFNPFLNSVSNQTGYSNSLAYSYNAYFNKVKTTQQTGIISLQFGAISVITENDILARPLLDRFRTGAFLIQYQYKDLYQAGINCTMWTGAMGRTIRNDSCFPAVGYIDTTGATYGKYSHGLLSAQFKYNMGLSQALQANIGIDAEQVRNAMQNRIIHDVCFLPKSWFKRYNCHIPMIDCNGNQYLYKPGQKIRKPSFYWNLFSDPNLFY